MGSPPGRSASAWQAAERAVVPSVSARSGGSRHLAPGRPADLLRRRVRAAAWALELPVGGLLRERALRMPARLSYHADRHGGGGEGKAHSVWIERPTSSPDHGSSTMVPVRYGVTRGAAGTGVYTAAAVAAGCFAFWARLRLGRSAFWLLPAMVSLTLFAYLLTRIDAAFAGRAYAAMMASILRPLCSGCGSSRARDLTDGT